MAYRFLPRAVPFLILVFFVIGCEQDTDLVLSETNLPPRVDASPADPLQRASPGPINTNPSFEQGLTGWSLYRAPSIANDAIIQARTDGRAKTGRQYVFMRLPARAKNNQSEYIHVGQRLRLSREKRYRYSVQVKWANPSNSLPSAIVSVWAQNPDGSFNGKDVWVTNHDSYQHLSFEFTPNESGEVFCYIALLTHQDGFANTDIYVDDLVVEEIGPAPADVDPRPAGQNLLKNSFFTRGFQDWTPTFNNPNGVSGLNRYLTSVEGNQKVRLELPEAPTTTYLNNTWTGLYQPLTLYAGNDYRIEATLDRVVPQGTPYPTIVNVYAYQPATSRYEEAWLGSVDYKFNRSDNHYYSQTISPTRTTVYYITVRVFGWGNDGRPVSVNIDNVRVKKIN